MLKLACIFLSAFIVAPLASAEIYKCIGKAGLDLYQNFPCPIDSPGWMPMDPQKIYKCVGKGGFDLYQNFPCPIDSLGWIPMDPQSQNAQSAESSGNSEGTKAAPPEVVEAGKFLSGVPRLGMTTEEVRTIWGEPTGDAIHGLVPIWYTEIADGSIEIWTYGTTRSVQFDQNGRVSVLRR